MGELLSTLNRDAQIGLALLGLGGVAVVIVLTLGMRPPSGTLTVNPSGSVGVGEPVFFTIMTTFVPVGGVHWSFGDGSVEAGGDFATNHTYGAAGTYTVRASMINAAGTILSLSVRIMVT